jgi:hypothetical protein
MRGTNPLTIQHPIDTAEDPAPAHQHLESTDSLLRRHHNERRQPKNSYRLIMRGGKRGARGLR